MWGEPPKNLNIAKWYITLSCNRTSTILVNLFIFLLFVFVFLFCFHFSNEILHFSDLKFPKMKFKGVKKATVIRTKTTEVFEQMTFSSTVVICTFCELIVYMTHTDVLLAYHVPRWGGRWRGGGGNTDFKWQGWSNGGKNQNPKKSLGQKLTPQKIPCQISEPKKFPESHVYFIWLYFIHRTTRPGDAGTTTILHIVLNIQTKSLLKSSHRKKHVPNSTTQKHPRIENFESKIIHSIIPSLEIQSTPPPTM